uniref:Uncharacterized protein n=1 Tax=Triticum urartu TaxID=4572 RepID=A0A8R7UD59_TRIUA
MVYVHAATTGRFSAGRYNNPRLVFDISSIGITCISFLSFFSMLLFLLCSFVCVCQGLTCLWWLTSVRFL